MRRFSAAYLDDTRRGMWADSREALAPLSLSDRETVLDVGCGAGAFTRVLREECPGTVVGVDADPSLLSETPPPRVAADATRLPFRDDCADLVACQALLVNLPDPRVAIREFARVSSDLVGVVEPDNSAVAVESTVAAESALAASAREAYTEGVATDVTLGADARALFADCGLSDVETTVYYHQRVTEPPYSERDVESARRKARATRLADAEQTLRSTLDDGAYEALVEDWRSMGRTVIEQMQDEAYRRAEVVPFYVTTGRVT